ncbi:hypothetical protein G4H71_02695 [Rhodococcus triatomae]|uniref:Uncharacterized conserved protein, contains Zn finger domain n=1 Tax=Rhodococcus triatomae TaxID=300028 RepID=A0A1G8LZ54_9NOCA|nr:SWIM zinc finger family protein [Rhodococcus triatomae]QNG18242.1 hypothetical protein G4H72_05345 [Rhodococcus triatomae]QNG22087.1 hypothetical protein G4H71_02695 [Rhodococcus triatomae]SDI60777.1 Uncharacterized conserved protein, contains Zn finger domain [Rhodococcus triatomae]
MSERDPRGSFRDYGRRRPVVGGVEARSRRGAFARNWWGRAFVDAVEAVGDAGRLSRGRTYARSGQVVALDITPGLIRAEVQGSQIQPFTASVSVRPLTTDEIEELSATVRRQPGALATLAGGTVPENLAPLLLPDGAAAFDFDCTCPDDGWPCKHAAAIVYLAAERIDIDPLLVLTLRGVRLDALMDAVGGGGPGSDEDWYGESTRLPRLPGVEFSAAIEDLDPLLLRGALRTVDPDGREVERTIAELADLYRRLR